MKKFYAAVLLIGLVAVNVNMLCQSLCATGHGDMAETHASHKTKGHETHDDICPVNPMTGHDASHHDPHTMPGTFLKCDCSADNVALSAGDITFLISHFDISPALNFISAIHPQHTILLSNETIPSEGPPRILA